MGGREALDGMARALLRRGVTSFLPTGYTQPWQKIVEFANTARAWSVDAPDDGADPLGFNLEGPFVAPARKGAHEPSLLRTPAEIGLDAVDAVLEGCRVMTVAPELPGALELIARLRERGVAASMGHSAATLEEAQAGYAAGGTTTTHLFNAMSGVDHHSPGLAVAALTDDDVYVELIADGHHVNESIWPIITRTKPVDRLMLISDAIPLAGMGDGRARIGGLEVEVVGGRVTLVGTTTLAGSVIALDSAVRNLARSGVPLPAAVAAASRNPLAMLGISDRGEIAVGQRADLVELDDDLRVHRVMRAGVWFDGPVD
jgi:N-acetylglucosamine-6-phosphate deacetylase